MYACIFVICYDYLEWLLCQRMPVGNYGILMVCYSVAVTCCHLTLYSVGIHKTEEPKLLLSHDLPMKGQSLITISPDALTVAVAIQRSIYLYGCSTGALLETMADCHEGVNMLKF